MWQILVITCVNIVMYYRTLKYGYVIDDVNMTHGKSSGNKWRDLWWEMRGLRYFNPKREHAIMLVLHTITSILVYLAFGMSSVSFLTAILFSVNPSNNQGAVWLSGKGYTFTALLILLGIWLSPLFPVFYYISFMWAGSGILAPLLFLFCSPLPYIILMPLCMYLFRKKTVSVLESRIKQATTLMKQLNWGKVVIAIKCFTYYIFLSLFPYKLGMYHTFCYTLGLSKEDDRKWGSLSPLFFISCLVIAGVVTAMIYGGSEIRWGLLWFTLFIVQWCNLTTLYQPIAERYLYLANAGMMYVLALLIISHPILIAIVLTSYIVRLYYFLPTYTSHLIFFKSNVDNFPDLYNAYTSYGAELFLKGKIGAAIDVWLDGLQYRADDFKLNANIANALGKIGNVGMALKYFETARRGINATTEEIDALPMIEKNIEQCKAILCGTGITSTHHLST